VLYKIALTSSDGEHIDLHFGSADGFYILQVDEETGTWEFLDPRKLPHDSNAILADVPAAADSCGVQASGAGCGGGGGCGASSPGSGCGHQDGRIQSVIDTLSDCRYIFTARIGKKPFTSLQRAGITALETQYDIPFAVSKLHAYHTKFGNINRNKGAIQ
jgi:predicted Fe-Mo cluster-binding NifX family protein